MRRISSILLLTTLVASPLAAQFEGTVNVKLTTASGEPLAMKMLIKGDKEVSIMTMPPSAGPMAGMEMRSIFDAKANTLTSLMPFPPGMPAMSGMADAKGFKSVLDFSKLDSSESSKATVKKLGTNERIAGYECEDYEITSANGSVTRACVTHSLGKFVFPEGGMGRRGGSQAPPWAKAFGNRPGFPLKVWKPDGKVDLEVTSVEKGSVPASMLEIPAGYVDMAGMRGRGGI